MLSFKTSPYNTRSSVSQLLYEPPSKCITFGDRAFSVAAPRLWNKLDIKLRLEKNVDSFKAKLKSHLFVNAKAYK